MVNQSPVTFSNQNAVRSAAAQVIPTEQQSRGGSTGLQ